MTATFEGAPVLSGSLVLPLNGAWTATLEVGTETLPEVGAQVTLELPGDARYVARVHEAGLFAERLHVRLTGSVNEWGRVVDVKHYRNSDGDQALRDLGVQTEAPFELDLPFWTRPLGTIGDAVQALARMAEVNWRVLSNGTVRIREEAPFTVEPDAIEISRDAARGIVEVAPDFAFIQPGVLVGDDSVGDVIYTIGEEGLRCRYYTQGQARIRSTIERIVRWVTRDAFYLGQFTCQVAAQAADGTLDLLPDDPRLRAQGLQAVPIRHGLPGVKVKVAAGARVLLGFDGGDPRKPYAALWHEGSVLSLELGGQLPVAIAQLVDAQLSTLAAAFDAHTHTWPGGLSPAPTTPPSGGVPPTPATVLTPTASQILKSS